MLIFILLHAVWFDVQREGKVGYHEAQVAELDFESSVKRVKFHFWRLSSDRDEWIEVGSPRIAPHVSLLSYQRLILFLLASPATNVLEITLFLACIHTKTA